MHTRLSPRKAMKGRRVVPLMRRLNSETPAVWNRILFCVRCRVGLVYVLSFFFLV